MAYDTVINKAQLEGAITASANAIREKTGDTALIEWLSDKGFAEAIAAIEAGGGGANIVAGTYTPASAQTSRVTVTHNLGTEPTGVLFAKYHTGYGANDTILFIWQTGGYGMRHMVYNSNWSPSQVSVSGANTQVHTQNHSNSDIVCGLTATTFQTPKNLYAGTYVWVVFGEVLK